MFDKIKINNGEDIQHYGNNALSISVVSLDTLRLILAKPAIDKADIEKYLNRIERGHDNLKTTIDIASKSIDKWKYAMEGLTPGGSEFVNDPEYCHRYLRDKLNELYEMRKRLVKTQRELEEYRR